MRNGQRLDACVVASHPMVIAELVRIIGSARAPVRSRRIPVGSDPTAVCAGVPKAAAYVYDACGSVHHDLAVVRSLVERSPGSAVLVLSEAFTAANALPFLRLGARGLLPYADAPRLLREALRQIARGRLWVSRDLVTAFVESTVQPQSRPQLVLGVLTRREEEVLQSILDNRSNKEIGNQLNISERTAKFHVANLLRKVGVRRRSDLIARWWQTCAVNQ